MQFKDRYRFYYDRIRINTFMELEDLEALIDTKAFRRFEHARTIKLNYASRVAKRAGYRSRVELYQATEAGIELLKQYDLGQHGVSYLEIARDRWCRSEGSTRRRRESFQERHYLRWGPTYWDRGTTRYWGKAEGKNRGLYLVCDLPPHGKFGDHYIVHVEFRLCGKASVRHKLGVQTLYDLGPAEDSFKLLENKYLVKAEVNQNRVRKHFSDEVTDLPHLMRFMDQQKEYARTREEKHGMFRLTCGSRIADKFGLPEHYVMSPKDKLLLSNGLGYWVKV